MKYARLRCGLLAALLVILALATSAAAADEAHSVIRFWLDTEADQELVQDNGGRWDIVAGSPGRFVDVVIPREDQAEWLIRGSRVEVVHDHVEAFYAARNGNREGFGAYHTFSEGIAWLDSICADHPEVVSPKWSLGQTYEGREIWCVRVSDNPTVEEPGEPQVLFDGLHHAREPMSSEMVLMFLDYLTDQYSAGDPEIVDLLNSNEVYMVPIVNPDGFVYNETIAPDGGGMWRKNRMPNGDGTYGVDPNRNYPYEWGCSWGSSGVTGDDDYRGPSPGSELEVQAMMQLVNDHDFVVRQSYHTYANVTLYPWGYTSAHTPDHATFVELAAAMCQYNGYDYGQPGEALWYEVCGGSFDWDYGQQDEHTRIFAFSNEIGSTGFWPTDAERQGLFDDNLWPALYLIAVAGDLRGPSFAHAPVHFQTPYAGPQTVIATVTGFGDADIDPATVRLYWRLDGGAWTEQQLTATGQPGEFEGLIPDIPGNGVVVEYYLAAADVYGYSGTAPRGAPDVLFTYEIADEFDHAMEADRGWTVGAADDDASRGIWVRVDPVGSTYDGNPVQPEDDHTELGTDAWITGQHVVGESAGYGDVDGGKTTLYSPVYDLAGGLNVAIRYWRWYTNNAGNNPDEDWWDVEISNDGGATWTVVEHTQASDPSWVEQQFMLAEYFPAPDQVQMRFVASDEINGSLVEAGVDDFLLVGDFGGPLGVDDGATPDALRVDLAAAPNPFNPLTTLRFRLPTAGTAQLGVFDLHGRLIKSLVRDDLPAGDHTVTWNGRDALGRPVSSGVYFVRLLTPDGEQLSRKLLLAK